MNPPRTSSTGRILISLLDFEDFKPSYYRIIEISYLITINILMGASHFYCMSLRAKQSQNPPTQSESMRLLVCDTLRERRSSSLRDALALAMTIIFSLKNKNWDAPY